MRKKKGNISSSSDCPAEIDTNKLTSKSNHDAVTQINRNSVTASDTVVRQGTKKIPRSCQDLRCMGQNISGLYSIIGAKFVETVFCDFSKQSTDSGKLRDFT